jgi:hypothetical protein
MGNQHSAPDKEKEKEREKEKEKENEKERELTRTSSRPEKHRRTVTATLVPPTETKVNAEQTLNNSIPTEAKPTVESSLKSSSSISAATSSSVKDRRASKQIPAHEVLEAVKNLNLKDLAPPTEAEIRKQLETTEPTPKFETVRVPSQSSIVDEDEYRESDKSGNLLISISV